MEAESFPKCSGFTDEQLKQLALLRGITSVVCCTILCIVLVLLAILGKCYYERSRVCGTVIKRFTIGLTAISVPCILTYALQLKHYFHPQDDEFCEADGFLVMYTGTVQSIFTIGISLVLFVKVWKATTSWKPLDEFYEKVKALTFTCCGWKVNIIEVSFYALMIVFPLLFDWIPFVTSSYGPAISAIAWCWIRNYAANNCSTDQAGLWEEILIWEVPFGLVAILVLGLFVTSLCLLLKHTKVHRLIEVGVLHYAFLLALLSLLFFLLALRIICLVYYFSVKGQHFTLWVTDSIAYPLTVTFIPLALLIVIYLPLSAMIARACHKRKKQIAVHQECDQATVHRSSDGQQQPSHTTWSPPHSFIEDSENVPLVRDQQQQDYGSNG